MPITPEKVAMFVAYMDSMGHARATIRRYVSALSREHKLVDEDDPIAKFWVRKVVEAAGSKASTPRVKRPITLEILRKILGAAKWVLAEFEASLMKVILISLAFHACTHIGEMVISNGQPQHAVLAKNLEFRAREVSIIFVSFKHHKGNAPETRIMGGGQAQMYALQQCSETTPNIDQASGQGPCLCGSQENKWRQERSGFAYNAV